MDTISKSIADKKEWELKLDILAFAFSHNLMVHPDKDLDGFCKRTIDCGHCICKDHELYCPCSEALSKCESQGFCTCRLFIRKDLYSDAIIKSRERLAIKDERKSNAIRSRTLRSM